MTLMGGVPKAHTNASIMISEDVDVVTMSVALVMRIRT